jgi:hypothetical protein
MADVGRLTMCSHCRSILPDFRLDHDASLCPLRKSSYCSHCAMYGHLLAMCPAKPADAFLQPIYLEQLIAPSDRVAFGIQSRTPLPAAPSVPGIQEGVLEIKNDDQVITAYLHARSIRIPRKVSKRQVLEEYAAQMGKRVVYI